MLQTAFLFVLSLAAATDRVFSGTVVPSLSFLSRSNQ